MVMVGHQPVLQVIPHPDKRIAHAAPGHDNRGYPEQGHGYPPQQGGYPPQQGGYPPQQGGYPPQQGGYPPQGQAGGYYGGSPAPPQGPPAPYGAPPPMPPGWIQQWDQNSQRWFYIEQATGRSQWDPPAQHVQGPYAPPPGSGGHDERGLFGNTHGGHDQHGYGGHGSHDSYGHGDHKDKDKKEKKGHSTAMLAAAGVGGVAAGALIGHQLGRSSSPSTLSASIIYP